MLENILGYAIVGLFLFGALYKVFGKSINIKEINQQKLEEAKTGWGIKQCEKLVKEDIEKLFKFTKKERILIKRKFYIGMKEVGKINKHVEIKDKIIIEVKINNFIVLSEYSYFIFNKKEQKYNDRKAVYFKDYPIINLHGMFLLSVDTKEKNEFLENIIDKKILNDMLGRITKMSSDVIYYSTNHSQEADLWKKKAEAYKADVNNKNKLQDMY